jgi:hypothetical protein
LEEASKASTPAAKDTKDKKEKGAPKDKKEKKEGTYGFSISCAFPPLTFTYISLVYWYK